MRKITKNNRVGLTLIEVMIATVVIISAVLGTAAFRYYSVFDARKADEQVSAARLGLMLLEGWKGTAGSLTYDPVAKFGSQLAISTAAEGPNAPVGFTRLGYYSITSDNTAYLATLSYRDETATVPKTLNASVSWAIAYKQTASSSSSNRQSVYLTVYSD